MNILLAGNGATVLELIRYFLVKWGNEVVVADGDDNIAKELELSNKYDVVVMGTATVIKHFKNSPRFTSPYVVCSIESSLKTPVEESGDIFVDKGSRRFIENLHVALDKIAVKIAKGKR